MASIQKFLQLPKTEKALIARSLFLVAAIRVLLWLVPTRLLQHLFASNVAEENGTTESNWKEIASIIRSVRTASRFVPHATCLTQALAASILIRKKGHTSEVKIGVTKDERSRLIAHAWLEKDGRIILGELPNQRQFVTLRAFSL